MWLYLITLILSIIVKLLTWVKHEIYKRFYSYYIEVSDSTKTQVLMSACTTCTIISVITTSSLRYTGYAIYLKILRLILNSYILYISILIILKEFN